MKKFLIFVLFVLLATSCVAITDNTGRTPEVASATKTAVAMLQPDFPSMEIQLFPNPTPEDLLPTVTPEPQTVCLDVAGNISSDGRKLYHLPGSANYHQVKIDKPGEQWFCSEQEAIDAGFVKAGR